MSFFDGFLTYLSILQIYDCFWMFGTNLEGSQRPVRTLQYKPQVGAKWCSYLELALSVNFFLIFRAFYSIKTEFFWSCKQIFLKINNFTDQFEALRGFWTKWEVDIWSLGVLKAHLRPKTKNGFEGPQRTVKCLSVSVIGYRYRQIQEPILVTLQIC